MTPIQNSRHYLVGSVALGLQTDFEPNETDLDIICPDEDLHMYDGVKGIDASGYSALNNSDMSLICVNGFYQTFKGYKLYFADLPTLALLKRSHLWRDLKWDRHMWLYQTYLKQYEVLWTDLDKEFLQKRIGLTKEKYPQGNPRLNQSNQDFFDDAVEKKFDHDWLHELVAFTDKPMYTRLKKGGREDSAWCEKDLWDQLSHMEKIVCVAEESHVIACERFMIPNDWTYPQMKAYDTALKKVCTTLCSGWFRDFAIDNYMDIRKMYSPVTFNNVRKATK